jgi:hypothetical protein
MVRLTPELCVVLADPSYYEETYTCTRTDGRKEQGWSLSKGHKCWNLMFTWLPQGHAHLDREHLGKPAPFWRVFLHNPVTETGHSCGWRPVGTFWPSRLDDDEAGRAAWIAGLIVHLDGLEAVRPKDFDPDYDAEPRQI